MKTRGETSLLRFHQRQSGRRIWYRHGQYVRVLGLGRWSLPLWSAIGLSIILSGLFRQLAELPGAHAMTSIPPLRRRKPTHSAGVDWHLVQQFFGARNWKPFCRTSICAVSPPTSSGVTWNPTVNRLTVTATWIAEQALSIWGGNRAPTVSARFINLELRLLK